MTKARQKGPEEPLVLIADDTESVRTLLSRAVQRGGYRVVAVANGREALDGIRDLRPAVALLDWHMPDLDGLEVCRAVRATPALAATPLVLLTGAPSGTDVDLDVDVVLGKPFELGELITVLAALVERED